MPKLSSIEIGSRTFGMAKGEPGTGKSRGVAFWPKPMYIFDFDGRIRSLLNSLPKEMHDEIEFDTYTAGDFLKFQNKLSWLERNPGAFRTLVLDSLTTVVDCILQYSRGIRGNDSSRDKSRKIGSIQLLEIEDYGAEAVALGDIIDFFRRQPAHFWMTAHVLTVETKDLNKKTVISRSLMTAGKKIAAKLPAYFDEIWHFDVRSALNVGDPPEYQIHTMHAGEDFAKTALPLPPLMKWSNQDLFKVVSAELKKKEVVIK